MGIRENAKHTDLSDILPEEVSKILTGSEILITEPDPQIENQ